MSTLKPEDVKVELWPQRERGGQHVLDRSCGIKVTHLPTGLEAFCDVYTSQHKNREVALSMIEWGYLAYLAA